MRIIPDYISQSVTVSTKTEAMLINIKDKYYFVEYPTNMPPHPDKFKNTRGNIVSEVTEEVFTTLKECVEKYIKEKVHKNYLHAPSYIEAWCSCKGIALQEYNILK